MFIKLLNHTQQKWYTCIYNLSLWIKICLTVYKGPQQSGRGRDGIRGKSPRGESEEWSCLLKTCWGDFSSCFVVNCFPHTPFFIYIFSIWKCSETNVHTRTLQSCSYPLFWRSYKKERIWTLLEYLLRYDHLGHMINVFSVRKRMWNVRSEFKFTFIWVQ